MGPCQVIYTDGGCDDNRNSGMTLRSTGSQAENQKPAGRPGGSAYLRLEDSVGLERLKSTRDC